VKELVIISGKGGTGKTSLAAAFAHLTDAKVLADVDVDAPDMHLILRPETKERHSFSGGGKARIDKDACISCGRCRELCHFDAISAGDEAGYVVDRTACEGCGLCALACPAEAIALEAVNNGEWFVSTTRFGTFVHARLGIAEENSGKLVTIVRNRAHQAACDESAACIVCDGAPGIGCPVTASITGADAALIVTEPTPSGLHDMGRVLELARHFAIPAAVVVNKWDINPGLAGEIERAAAAAGARPFGRIDYDETFIAAQKQQMAITEYAPDGDAAGKVREIHRNLFSALEGLQ